jgi:hypothetical protein
MRRLLRCSADVEKNKEERKDEEGEMEGKNKEKMGKEK